MSNLTTRIPQLLAAAACAVALVGAASPAMAGRGGSYAAVQNAINTNSKDAIIAELERSEFLICDRCIAPVMDLLDDDRYAVREVAAWWFARRPVIAAQLVERSYADLEGSDSRLARNAADILGTFRDPDALPALEAAVTRTTLSAEARTAVVRAIGTIGNARGSDALAAAMGDSDASVRHEALVAWIAIRRQRGAAPAVALVADPDAKVRARAAAVVGEMREASGRSALEAQLASDDDPTVRRNAAWALGRIGDAASRPALEAATQDASSIVRATARAAIRQLR